MKRTNIKCKYSRGKNSMKLNYRNINKKNDIIYIGIVTIHYGFNFGSVLQCYALSRFLSNIDNRIKVEVINYIPSRYSIKRRYFTFNKKFGLLKNLIYLSATMPYKMVYQRIFNTFLNRYIPLTKKVCNTNDLNRISSKYNILIAGSDQIWNSDYNEGIDPVYYLNFGKEEIIRVAYAASCGKESYNLEEWKRINKYLRRFDNISIREIQSLEMLKQHGYKDFVLALDPIFLIKKSEWLVITTSVQVKSYVLVYCLDSDIESLLTIANRFAKKKGLKTVLVNYCHYWNKYNVDYTFRYQSPTQFLSLINNAEYIITNSFHGIAFSINFQKQFFAYKRKKYNNRIDSLLEILNLKKRYITENSCLEEYKTIDYSKIDRLKEQYVKESKDFLRSILIKV